MIVKATRKLTSVLLDAVIVIEAHALVIWSNLVGKVEILVPSTVVRKEA
jgi:predicted membrane protein